MTEWMMILWAWPCAVSFGLHTFQMLQAVYYAYKLDGSLEFGDKVPISFAMCLVPVANIFLVGLLVSAILMEESVEVEDDG